jgi:hypothetical protein
VQVSAGLSITLYIEYIKAVHTCIHYSIIIKLNLAHIGIDKWVKDLDIHIENEAWTHVYMLPFRSSIDSNLRYLQYRILQRILTTNRFLFIIKVVDLDRCSFCDIASETLVHMCVECNYVSDVWNQLHAWLVKNGYTPLEPFSKRDVLLGIDDVDIVVNLIYIQIAKLSIYRCRVNKSRPRLFKALIKCIRWINLTRVLMS